MRSAIDRSYGIADVPGGNHLFRVHLIAALRRRTGKQGMQRSGAILCVVDSGILAVIQTRSVQLS
jgi:hypothetical protein